MAYVMFVIVTDSEITNVTEIATDAETVCHIVFIIMITYYRNYCVFSYDPFPVCFLFVSFWWEILFVACKASRQLILKNVQFHNHG